MIAIKHRYTGNTICEFDVKTLCEAAEKGKSNLRGADLRGADLRGANLRGANLGEKFGKLKERGFFSAGPLGSREDWLVAFHTDKGIFVRAGCFFDSLELFREKVVVTHGEESEHGKLYLSMANVIEFKFSE